VVQPCSYVEGSREKAMAGKPGLGQPSSTFEGYLIDAAGNPLKGYGVYCEHPSEAPTCVVTGDPTENWDPGAWKHTFWAPAPPGYYITIKESCAPGAPALSIKEEFRYKTWRSGHQFNITFRCNF